MSTETSVFALEHKVKLLSSKAPLASQVLRLLDLKQLQPSHCFDQIEKHKMRISLTSKLSHFIYLLLFFCLSDASVHLTGLSCFLLVRLSEAGQGNTGSRWSQWKGSIPIVLGRYKTVEPSASHLKVSIHKELMELACLKQTKIEFSLIKELSCLIVVILVQKSKKHEANV